MPTITQHHDDFAIFDAHISHFSDRASSKNEQFGLLGYNYNNEKHEKGYYNPRGCNIGDYIQALASMQFLPSVDYIIYRDQIGQCPKHINIIMNAWWWIWKKNKVFSPNITPLLVSMHINAMKQ